MTSQCANEPTINQLLDDPLIQTVMAADAVDAEELEAMLRSVARDMAKRSVHERSLMGRLLGLLASYYDVARGGCACSYSRFHICRAP